MNCFIQVVSCLTTSKFIDKKIKKKLMESTYHFNDVTIEYPTTLFIISLIK